VAPPTRNFAPELDKPALARALLQYREGNPDRVFAAREQSCFLRKMGMGGGNPQMAALMSVLTMASTDGGAPRFFMG
jgi:hypothetical protein